VRVLRNNLTIYSPKRGGENPALLVQEFIMISFLMHLDIIRFNQALFDISFLPFASFAALRETSCALRIYLPNRGKGAKEEAKKSFLFIKR
jgi:hypothetical protein